MLIGSSFVFKKKGLLRSQAGHVAGEGVAYLKSVSTLYNIVSEAIYLYTMLSGIIWDLHDFEFVGRTLGAIVRGCGAGIEIPCAAIRHHPSHFQNSMSPWPGLEEYFSAP